MADLASSSHTHNGAILLKVSGSLSIIASSLMLRDLRRRYRRDKRLPLTSSILCELAVADLVSSFMWAMGTWMVPKDSGAYWAAGNTASCTAQGFLLHCFVGISCLSNASLAVSYCLIVRRGWDDNLAKTRKVLFLLAFPPIFCLVYTVIPLFFSAYNFNGKDLCQMAPFPYDCRSSSEIECTRGELAPTFFLGATAILFVANVVIVLAMALLIQSVLSQEKKMDRYAVDGNQASRVQTTRAAWQGLWYIAAFAVTLWPFYVRVIIDAVTGAVPTPFIYITNLTFPGQGIWNAFIYFRPQYRRDRERNPTDPRLSSMGRVLHLSHLQVDHNVVTVKQNCNQDSQGQRQDKSSKGKEGLERNVVV